jgi:NAD(P)-dependent dehydrogenase (short-subunit alcohol dehydrogenase family)
MASNRRAAFASSVQAARARRSAADRSKRVIATVIAAPPCCRSGESRRSEPRRFTFEPSVPRAGIKPPDATVAAIREAGGEAIGLACDVTGAAALARLVQATDEAFGSVHILVNNAALFATLALKLVEQITSEEWDRVMAANVRGSFECANAVLPVMRRQGSGKIINIASGTVFKVAPMILHYVASKGAVVAMTRSIAREVAMPASVATAWPQASR